MKTLSYDPRVKEFLLEYLGLIGAEVEHLKDDLIRATIPEEYASSFDDRREILLAFRFADMKGHDDAEFVTFGSYYLDNVIRDCLARGNVLQRYVRTDQALDEASLRTFPAEIAGATVTPGETAHVYLPYPTFTFLIRYNADRKIEDIRSVTVNPATMKPVTREDLAFLQVCTSEASGQAPFECRDEVHALCLDAARRRIQAEVGERGRQIESELAPRLQKELARLEQYYDEAIAEAQNSRRQDPAVETRRLEAEKAVRIREETERYGLVVEYRVLSASCLQYPFAERTFTVSRDGLSRDTAVRFDLPRRRPAPLLCEACQSECTQGALCDCSHIVCTGCVRACTVCGKEVCASCILGTCHITQQPVCTDCGFTCPVCGNIASNEHKLSCHVGGETMCSACGIRCAVCGEVSCASHTNTCAVCNRQACHSCSAACSVCGKVACSEHQRTCAFCGRIVCTHPQTDCHVACTVCGKDACPEHGAKCRSCGKSFCQDHLRTCHVCGHPFCEEHTAACPACGELSCLRHQRTCSVCRQTYCQACFDRANTCKACSAALKGKNGPIAPAVRVVLEEVGAAGELEAYGKWRAGENASTLVAIGEGFFGSTLLVVDKASKALVHSHKVGMIGRLFGRR